MKKRSLVGLIIFGGGLFGCQESGTAIEALNEKSPIDQTGQYTFGESCNVFMRTFNVNETTIRMAETVCEIKTRKSLNSSSVEYELSNCTAEGSAEPDRTVSLTEIEDGLLDVRGWSNDHNFIVNKCD